MGVEKMKSARHILSLEGCELLNRQYVYIWVRTCAHRYTRECVCCVRLRVRLCFYVPICIYVLDTHIRMYTGIYISTYLNLVFTSFRSQNPPSPVRLPCPHRNLHPSFHVCV